MLLSLGCAALLVGLPLAPELLHGFEESSKHISLWPLLGPVIALVAVGGLRAHRDNLSPTAGALAYMLALIAVLVLGGATLVLLALAIYALGQRAPPPDPFVAAFGAAMTLGVIWGDAATRRLLPRRDPPRAASGGTAARAKSAP